MSDEQKVRAIKRYANRKLYDTEDSRYVTLDEIADLVKAGEDVRIIDNRTGEDLTEVTLAQILFEEQKKQKTRMPLGLLKDLISSSGESITDFIQRRVTQPVQTIKEEAARQVDKIVKKSESTVDEKARSVREFFASTQNSFDEIQKNFDDRVHSVLSTMPDVRGQLKAIKQRIEELEARLTSSPEGAEEDKSEK